MERPAMTLEETMAHGEWLPWLEHNEKALGFGESAARKLIAFSNRSLTTDLTEQKALEYGRDLWGHKPPSERKKATNSYDAR